MVELKGCPLCGHRATEEAQTPIHVTTGVWGKELRQCPNCRGYWKAWEVDEKGYYLPGTIGRLAPGA